MGGKLVFITGASSGIGQALAMRYYQAGWSLALAARRTGAIEQWARASGVSPDRLMIYTADVADLDSIVDAGRACMIRQGVPDRVIANAGVSFGIDTAVREDLDGMQDLFAVNTVGMAATFHPFVEPMRARGSGTLVGIASVTGIRGLPGHGGYCASKAAAISYCESLRGEMRGSGVKVVTLCPGYVDTPLTSGDTHSKPFMLSPGQFAERAFRAIEAGTSYRVIPWQMAIVAKLLRLMPNALFDAVLADRPRKPRRKTARR